MENQEKKVNGVDLDAQNIDRPVLVRDENRENYGPEKLNDGEKNSFENEIFSLTQSLKDLETDLEKKNYSGENEKSGIEFKNQLGSLIKNLDGLTPKIESTKNLEKNSQLENFKTEILNLQLQILSGLRQDEFVKSNPSIGENIQNSIENFAQVIAKKNKEKIIFETKKNIPEIVKFYGPAGNLVKKIFQKAGLYNS